LTHTHREVFRNVKKHFPVSACRTQPDPLRPSLAKLYGVDSQTESGEFYQTLFFRRNDSYLILRSDYLKLTNELRGPKKVASHDSET
jgi:hypothetical protein